MELEDLAAKLLQKFKDAENEIAQQNQQVSINSADICTLVRI